MAPLVHQDVARLDVAVDDAERVDLRQGCCQLGADFLGGLSGVASPEGSGGEDGVQASSRVVVHGQVEPLHGLEGAS